MEKKSFRCTVLNLNALTLLMLSFGCGYHHQETEVIDPPRELITNEETNFDLLVINAVEKGDPTELQSLIDQGANLDLLSTEGMTLLMLAIRSGQLAVVQILMDNNLDPNEQVMVPETDTQRTAFDFLAPPESQNPMDQIMRSLVQKEEIDTESLNEALFSVIDKLHGDNLEWILNQGADPNAIKDKKTSPLIALLSIPGVKDDKFHDLKKIFDTLLSHPDIDVTLKVRRNTPLKKAKRRAKKNPQFQVIVDKLVARGAQ